MTELAAVVYPTSAEAHAALAALRARQDTEALAIIDAIVAIKTTDDAVHLEQTVDKGASGAGAGAFWGSLVDLVFMAPVAGATLGAALGGVAGYGRDFGIDDDFALGLSKNLLPGHAAVLVMIDDDQAEALAETLSAHGGALLYSTLSDEADRSLRAALDDA